MMPGERVHRTTKHFVSRSSFISGLSFGRIVTIAICGFILLAIGLTLTAVGSNPTKYGKGPLGGKVPLNSGSKPMLISGIVLMIIGAGVFFGGLGLAIRSARTKPKRVGGDLKFVRGRTRESLPTRNVVMLPPFDQVRRDPNRQHPTGLVYYIDGLEAEPTQNERRGGTYRMQPSYNPAYVENEI